MNNNAGSQAGTEHRTRPSTPLRARNTKQQTRNNKHGTTNNNQIFPNQAMLNFHPQRWNDALIPWVKELVWQNVKNQGKRILVKLQ